MTARTGKPHIKLYQEERERRLGEAELRTLVEALTEKRSFGILGEPRVNLLKLNLALDELAKTLAPLPATIPPAEPPARKTP